MFERILQFQQMQTTLEHVSMEGYIDELKKLFLIAEKKADPEKNRRYVKEADELCARIMRTYGNPSWVRRRGCVKTSSISGENIRCYLEINGVMPNDLAAAARKHMETVNTIIQRWKEKINTYHVVLQDAFEASQKCKTVAEQAKFIDVKLKHVSQPDLTKGLSLNGLMGNVSVKYNRLVYADVNNGEKLSPLSEAEISEMAKLTCWLVKEKFPSATNGFITPPHGYLTELEVDGRGDSEDSLYKTIEKHYPHVEDLLGNDQYLGLYGSVSTSAFNISQALERWMHRSIQ